MCVCYMNGSHSGKKITSHSSKNPTHVRTFQFIFFQRVSTLWPVYGHKIGFKYIKYIRLTW